VYEGIRIVSLCYFWISGDIFALGSVDKGQTYRDRLVDLEIGKDFGC
jgi:hypothetical protein